MSRFHRGNGTGTLPSIGLTPNATGIENPNISDKEFSRARTTLEDISVQMNGAVEIYPHELDALRGALALEESVILNGDPGEGKTKTAEAFAKAIGGVYGRYQGSPDNVPSDLRGTEVWSRTKEAFEFRPGPVFSNVLLADEINRNTTRSQAGLLQAMQERQVTIGGATYLVPRPFVVLATQNFDERLQGTYPLPRAQIDRFGLSVDMAWTDDKEAAVLDRDLEDPDKRFQVRTIDGGLEAVKGLQVVTYKVIVPKLLRNGILQATRFLRKHPSVDSDATQLSGGRKNAKLARLSQYEALKNDRKVATDADLAEAAPLVLGHRIGLTEEAIENKVTVQQVIEEAVDEARNWMEMNSRTIR